MAKTMTPSESVMTAGQIGKVQELFGAGLRKANLPNAPVQQVLEHQGESLVVALVAVVRKIVEAACDMIVRTVSVIRTRTPQEAIKATGRAQYVSDEVVAAMPRGKGETAETVFFKLDLSERGGYINDADLDKEYELRGLVPEDPYSLSAQNEADPAFADDHPNATHWKDSSGKWCYIAFDRWRVGGRCVCVGRYGCGWRGYWWFAGSRKYQKPLDS
ncbi:MAG: hypothetical protein UR98_C0011G0013 [Parcubacteria group bacterium GW2011_GWA1_36_12]|nr:MAG: hypothetical protein UR98_C0011G0013 [Parcubacteria group bacterium GW2011_GWA1_36_12]